MTERKFTPPTEFPAEYITEGGYKVTLLGRTPNGALIGYYHSDNTASTYTQNGVHCDHPCLETDLHDIPKRVKTYHNRYSFGLNGNYESVPEINFCNGTTRTHVYIIEADEDGSNPTIEAIDVRDNQ